MQWEFIVALLIVIPVIIFPLALIWYVNLHGFYTKSRLYKTRNTVKERSPLNLSLAKADKDYGDSHMKSNWP